MKKLFPIILMLLLGTGLQAQLDRSVRPEPAPSEELEFGEYKLYTLDNGLRIIVVKDDKLPRVAFSMLVDRDPIKEGDKAGYVGLAGEMLRQGTTNRPKDKLDEEIDFMGASLFTSATSIYTAGLSKYTDELVEIMADVALNPAFPKEEFDKLKKQSLSDIKQAKESPNALSSRLFQSTTFGLDHPYGELRSEATIDSIELSDCQDYYQKYWAPNQTIIAVVGDISNWKAKRLIKKHFGDWARKEVPSNEYEAPASPTGQVVNFMNRSSSAQSVIKIGNTIDLKPGSEDIVKLALANQILGVGSMGRLFQNIREDKGYTYGAYSSYDDDRLIGSFSANASVRNEVTDSAITEFLYEFKRMHEETVDAKTLQDAKNYISGSFGRALESPRTIARFALNIERYGLPKNYYENYLKRLNALTAEEVQEAARKYIKLNALNITVVGKASEVAGGLEQFGPITYYDFLGQETDPPSLPIPEGVTAEEVIKDYIAARGGQEKLDAVKDLSISMQVQVAQAPPGTVIKARELKMEPHYYLSEMNAQGMGTLNKIVYNGKTAKVSGMGGSQEVSGEDAAPIAAEAKLFSETKYLENNYQLELTSVEFVEGEKAYVMEITDPSGENTVTQFYSVETGLKLQEVSKQTTPQGEVTSVQKLSDYKEVDGIMFAHSIEISGPQSVSMQAEEIKVNSGLTKADFE